MEHFLEGAGPADPGRDARRFDAYDWPGNVRELKHCVERMIALRSEGALQAADLPSALQNFVRGQRSALAGQVGGAARRGAADLPADAFAASGDLASPTREKQAISARAGGHQRRAGEGGALLEIGRTTLYRKMKQYKLE